MISFPSPPYAYQFTPWTDPNGIQWIYNSVKNRWARYRVASTGGVSSFNDLTDVPAALTSPQIAATPSIRAIGLGATDAAAGNHTHTDLTNATSSPTVSTIVKRDINGAFEAVTVYITEGTAQAAYGASGFTLEGAFTVQVGTANLTDGRSQEFSDGNGNLALTQNADGKPDTLHNATISGTCSVNTVLSLAENAAIALDPAGSADEKWTGITCTGTAGATVAVGDLLYLDVTAGEWLLADADAAATAGPVILGLCLLASTDGAATNILLSGTMRSAAFPASIALGAPVYASGTAGNITATAPTGTGKIVRVLGWAITVEPNTIYFNPAQDWIELA